MREVICARYSCGGEVAEVPQTDEEQREFNCPRGCCGAALQCRKCGVRFVIQFAAPEMD